MVFDWFVHLIIDIMGFSYQTPHKKPNVIHYGLLIAPCFLKVPLITVTQSLDLPKYHKHPSNISADLIILITSDRQLLLNCTLC